MYKFDVKFKNLKFCDWIELWCEHVWKEKICESTFLKENWIFKILSLRKYDIIF